LNVREGIRNKHIENKYIQNILLHERCISLIGTFLEIETKIVFGKVFRILSVFMEKEFAKVQILIRGKKLLTFFSSNFLYGAAKLTNPSYPL